MINTMRNIEAIKIGDIILELNKAKGKKVINSGYVHDIDDHHSFITVYWYNEMEYLTIRKWMVSEDGIETKYQWIGDCG